MPARPVYGTAVPSSDSSGGVVASVEPGSPAECAGVRPADVILTADGEQLRDIIDWRWHADGDEVSLTVLREAGATATAAAASLAVELHREPGELWGIEFAEPLFDGVRTCRNRCTFCFMTQLPRGLRPALYLRDDDFRLSFLQGNFVTLTNLTQEDIDRIIEQNLSPLYVSLHSVTPHIREQLLCVRGEDHALATLDTLVEHGIDVHVQIVAVPGVNDTTELDRTLEWLAARDGILSVGVVPLGYTSHQSVFTGSFEDPASAAAILDRIAPWRDAFALRDGVRWVHAADEFYLTAAGPLGAVLPSAEEYDGFPQYENGIGLVRAFIDEWERAATGLGTHDFDAVVVTGKLFAPVLADALYSAGAGESVRVLGVANRFFGGNVSVAGLLTAADVVAAIIDDASPAAYLVPDVIVNADGLTLDGAPWSALADQTGADVRLVSSTAAGLAAALAEARTRGSH